MPVSTTRAIPAARCRSTILAYKTNHWLISLHLRPPGCHHFVETLLLICHATLPSSHSAFPFTHLRIMITQTLFHAALPLFHQGLHASIQQLQVSIWDGNERRSRHVSNEGVSDFQTQGEMSSKNKLHHAQLSS